MTHRVVPARSVLAVTAVLLAVRCAGGLAPPAYTVADVESEQALLAAELVGERIALGAAVHELEHRLATAAAGFCAGLTQPRLGGILATVQSLPSEAARDAARALGLDERLSIVSVVPGGPLDAAGLRAGDVVVRAGRRAVASDADVRAALAESLDALALEVERDGAPLVRTVRPAPACPVTLGYASNAQLLPVAVGRARADVPRGALVMFPEADARAVLVAHQLAHLIFDRESDGEIEAERRADRLGLYLAARAGYDVSGAVRVWEVLVAEYPWLASPRGAGEYRGYPHQGVALRMAGIRAAVREIAERRARGEPLVPPAD